LPPITAPEAALPLRKLANFSALNDYKEEEKTLKKKYKEEGICFV
jgi:hypothetical protein